MLAFYAERFNTVEVNYTFYRMPTPPLLEGWAKGTPEAFTFTLKAPRRITHDAKLQRCEDLTQVFCKTASTLGSKLGVLLFQLPPTFKRDDAVLGSFLDLLPEGTRAAFEFRHTSWHDEAVFEALRRRNLALCVADSEKMSTPVVRTASYLYFRLRDEGDQAADIARGARVLLLYPPGLEFLVGFFGCLYAGLIPVPAYPPRSTQADERLQAIAGDASPVVAASSVDMAGRLGGRVALGDRVPPLDCLALETVPPEAADGWRAPALDASAIAHLQYTSGSTPTPKGVVVPHPHVFSTPPA